MRRFARILSSGRALGPMQEQVHAGKGEKELLERGSRLFPVQVLRQGGRFQGHRLSQTEKKGRT